MQEVELPQRSRRYREMIEAAEEYYALLEHAKDTRGSDAEGLDRLKRRLDELAMPYGDNPAYQAFLRMERLAAIGE